MTKAQRAGELTPFPGSYPTNPPLCHSNVRAVPTGTVEEPRVTHSQKVTVEDADEALDEEQKEDEEVVEENLPWIHSPFTAGQFVPLPSLVEAGAALNDLKLLIQPRRTSGIGHKDPQLDLLLRSRLEKMRMFLWNYTKPIGACRWQAASLMTAKLYNEPDFVNVKSFLEIACEARGFRAIFFPKFHCELNFIEQCWGYSKQVYREFPMSFKEADLERNVLAALEAVPLDAIRCLRRVLSK